MKIPTRLIITGLVAAVLLSAVCFKLTYAQSALSQQQLQHISDNCLSIKSTLNQLHASDALLRVNRGQLYESVGSKLMNNFNARLSNNSLDNKGLVVVTNDYQTMLTSFRNDYTSYERQLSAAIQINCDTQPSEFHTAVEDARTKRDKLHTDVGRLNQYIDDYRSAVNDFLINYQRTSGSN